jgi:hypothetical protein
MPHEGALSLAVGRPARRTEASQRPLLCVFGDFLGSIRNTQVSTCLNSPLPLFDPIKAG